jgi:hypothetical protein
VNRLVEYLRVRRRSVIGKLVAVEMERLVVKGPERDHRCHETVW